MSHIIDEEKTCRPSSRNSEAGYGERGGSRRYCYSVSGNAACLLGTRGRVQMRGMWAQPSLRIELRFPRWVECSRLDKGKGGGKHLYGLGECMEQGVTPKGKAEVAVAGVWKDGCGQDVKLEGLSPLGGPCGYCYMAWTLTWMQRRTTGRHVCPLYCQPRIPVDSGLHAQINQNPAIWPLLARRSWACVTPMPSASASSSTQWDTKNTYFMGLGWGLNWEGTV